MTTLNPITSLRAPDAIDTVHTGTAYAHVFPRLVLELTAVIFVASILFASIPVSAAQLQPQLPTEIVAGQTISVPFILDSQGENINAIEGNLHYPGSLTLKDIRDGNSAITFWVEKPKLSEGAVHFSGITPGGFTGSGEIFTLVFTVAGTNNPTFTLEDARALLNDGQASDAALTIGKTLTQIPGSPDALTIIAPLDTMPPDTFVPEVTADPYLYEGKYVVVFVAQDKGSGVDHYEVAEREGMKSLFFGGLTYTPAQSPYVLEDQTLHSYIYVKAVDRSHNERVITLPPKHLSWYYNVDILAFILVALILLGCFAWNYARSKKRY